MEPVKKLGVHSSQLGHVGIIDPRSCFRRLVPSTSHRIKCTILPAIPCRVAIRTIPHPGVDGTILLGIPQRLKVDVHPRTHNPLRITACKFHLSIQHEIQHASQRGVVLECDPGSTRLITSNDRPTVRQNCQPVSGTIHLQTEGQGTQILDRTASTIHQFHCANQPVMRFWIPVSQNDLTDGTRGSNTWSTASDIGKTNCLGNVVVFPMHTLTATELE